MKVVPGYLEERNQNTIHHNNIIIVYIMQEVIRIIDPLCINNKVHMQEKYKTSYVNTLYLQVLVCMSAT